MCVHTANRMWSRCIELSTCDQIPHSLNYTSTGTCSLYLSVTDNILLPGSLGGVSPPCEQRFIGGSKFNHPPGVLIRHCGREDVKKQRQEVKQSDVCLDAQRR